MSLATSARDGDRQPGGMAGITIVTEDLRGDYDRLTAAGVTFIMPPTPMPWGDSGAIFNDPDGNEFFLAGPARQS